MLYLHGLFSSIGLIDTYLNFEVFQHKLEIEHLITQHLIYSYQLMFYVYLLSNVHSTLSTQSSDVE